jgi:hypothetical protein
VKPRGLTTTQRGYGTRDHGRARKTALAQLRDGDPCAECRELGRYHPMYRSQAAALDLSHNRTRTGYLGLSHAHCNRREGAIRGARIRHATTQHRTRYSRQW